MLDLPQKTVQYDNDEYYKMIFLLACVHNKENLRTLQIQVSDEKHFPQYHFILVTYSAN